MVLVHAILLFLPFDDLSVYVPDIVATAMESFQSLEWCNLRGLPYLWDAVRRSSTWAHGPELSKMYNGRIRLLVVAADKGSEIWAMIQCMALFFFMCIFFL